MTRRLVLPRPEPGDPMPTFAAVVDMTPEWAVLRVRYGKTDQLLHLPLPELENDR
jgi:hypothetical protein